MGQVEIGGLEASYRNNWGIRCMRIKILTEAIFCLILAFPEGLAAPVLDV